MAGAFLSVDVLGQGDITKALNKLIKQGTELNGAFRDIGEHLLESTEQRFNAQQAPDGTPWAPLQQKTVEAKLAKKKSSKILRGDGHLADLLSYQINKNQLTFGSNQEYAATHQFGRDSANIPARPFLGLSSSDEVEVLDILRTHLSQAL